MGRANENCMKGALHIIKMGSKLPSVKSMY